MDDKTTRQEELRRRFSAFKPQIAEATATPEIPPPIPAHQKPAPAEPSPEPRSLTRRRDYKGERRRLNLRLPAALTDDLSVLCLASGVDKNAFCEEILSAAVEKQLDKVRKSYKPEEWEGILRCVREGKGL